MDIFNTVKSTLNTAADTVSSVAQTFIEKNRTKAKLNRLRMLMKNESELMNRAYIALGKEYYEMLQKDEVTSNENQKKLAEVIDRSKAKIAKARDCYRKVLESQNEFIYAAPPVESEPAQNEVIDITVACSNESDYSSNPFETAEQKPEAEEASPEDIVISSADDADDTDDADSAEEIDSIQQAAKDALDEEYPEDELF